jgi:hypothetical protein
VAIAAETIVPSADLLATVGAAYTRTGVTVVETPVSAIVGEDTARGTAVIAADLGIVECILPDDTPPASLASGVAGLAAAGWDVNVLVPLERLGEAHRGLRGRPTRLQAWWLDPEHGICFGKPEVP